MGRGHPGRPADPRPAGVRRRSTAASCRPGPSVTTDQEIHDWVASDAETALHPSCTARMGTDEGSVLDPLTMRVHGIDGLRVVDASAMPYVTNGNIYAPVMMLAEKAADLILGATPLPPEPIPFYRHGVARPSCRPRGRAAGLVGVEDLRDRVPPLPGSRSGTGSCIASVWVHHSWTTGSAAIVARSPARSSPSWRYVANRYSP